MTDSRIRTVYILPGTTHAECLICRETKPIDAFKRGKTRKAQRHWTICDECAKERLRIRRELDAFFIDECTISLDGLKAYQAIDYAGIL